MKATRPMEGDVKAAIRGAVLVAFVVGVATLTGCTEATQIRSYPAGSKVYINDAFVGLTPMPYRVASADIGRDYRVRIEHQGYLSAEGMLKKEVSAGRVTGSVFSFGILLLFKSPTCFATVQDFALTECADEVSPVSHTDAPSSETRLQRLERMHADGIITDEERSRYRDAILREP